MKQLMVTLFVCVITAVSAFGQETDEITWTNYFGIGGGIEVKNIEQDHTTLQVTGAVSRRIIPHFHLMLQGGYYPFSDSNILSVFGNDCYDILTVGTMGKIATARSGHGPSFYLLSGGGWATLKNMGKGPFVSVGAGFETEIATRLGAFVQTQYIVADPSDNNVQFINLSVGISFSPQ